MRQTISKLRAATNLWPVLLLIAGISLTAVLGNVLQQRATESWRQRAAQETTQLSASLLAWVEESYGMLSGLDALVENSGSVEADEFLNAVDGMESRAKVNFMSAKAMLEHSAAGWRVRYSSAGRDADKAYPREGEVPTKLLSDTLDRAQEAPNEWIMSSPFDGGDGKKHVYVVLATARNPEVALAGVFGVGRMLDNLFAARKIEGVQLNLKLKAEGSEAIEFVAGKPNRRVVHSNNTLLYTARASLDLTWLIDDEFAGGIDRGLARGIWVGGALLSIVMAFFVSMLIKQNQHVQQRVEAATRDLERAVAAKNEVAGISLAIQQAGTPGECGEILLSRFAGQMACRQGMLAVVVPDGHLDVVARYGAPPEGSTPSSYAIGEGLVGQCARDRQPICFSLPTDEAWRIRSGLGSSAPADVRLFPIVDGSELIGVLELAMMVPLDDSGKSLLEELMPVIALRLGDLVRRTNAGSASEKHGVVRAVDSLKEPEGQE